VQGVARAQFGAQRLQLGIHHTELLTKVVQDLALYAAFFGAYPHRGDGCGRQREHAEAEQHDEDREDL